MKISACVIVKNEEKNIQQWLSCMKDIADEMIVVDTGSGDRTVELAKAGGARVYHFKWRNDFSAAKNYALDRATGDWIFFLDADEYFSESTRKRIRSLLERAHDGRLPEPCGGFHILAVQPDGSGAALEHAVKGPFAHQREAVAHGDLPQRAAAGEHMPRVCHAARIEAAFLQSHQRVVAVESQPRRHALPAQIQRGKASTAVEHATHVRHAVGVKAAH